MFDLYVCVVCTEVHGGSDGVVASYGNTPDGTTYESSFSDCDSMATDQPSHKETVADVDNPLYSNTDPVTFSESTVHESVSKHLSSLSLPNFSQFIVIILISLFPYTQTDYHGVHTNSSLECSYVPSTVCDNFYSLS